MWYVPYVDIFIKIWEISKCFQAGRKLRNSDASTRQILLLHNDCNYEDSRENASDPVKTERG
jgi:hypothetical protein